MFSITLTPIDFGSAGISSIVDSDSTINSVDENSLSGTTVGITASASDGAHAITYTLVDDDGGRFAINGSTGVVTLVGALDRETDGASRSVTVRATSAGGTFSERTFSIAVGDVDEFDVGSVTDTNASSNSVAELVPVGTVVGVTAAASDSDATATITYSLTDDAGGTFAIDANTGVVTTAADIDREADGSALSITIRATSSDGSFAEQSFTINISGVNEFAISAISDTDASANEVAENSASGTTVGITAHATDADATDTVTYSLADDDGGKFAIDGATGVVALVGSLDYDADGPTRTIIVRSTSSDGSYRERSFTIDVLTATALPSGAWFKYAFDEGSGPIVQNKAVGDIAWNDVAGAPEQMFRYASPSPDGTITDQAGTAPDGSNNAARWTAAAGSLKQLSLPIGTIPAGTHTISCYMRSASGNQGIHFSYTDGVTVTTATETIGVTDKRVIATITTSNAISTLYLANDGSTAVDLYLWGFMLEPGSAASDYPALNWQGFFRGNDPPTWSGEGVDVTNAWLTAVSASRPKSLTAFTLYIAAKKTAAGSNYAPLFASDLSVPPSLYLYGKDSGNNFVGFSCGGIGGAQNKTRMDDSQYHVFALTCDGSTARMFMDGTQVLKKTGTMGTITVDRFWISNIGDFASLEFPGKVAYAVGYDAAHDAATVRSATHAIQSLISPRGISCVDMPELIVYEGDSITYAFTPTTLSPTVKFVNVAVPGSTIDDVSSRAADVDEYHRPGQNSIYHLLIGANDLLNYTAAAYLAKVKTECLARRAAGFKIVLCTPTPQDAATWPGFNDLRDEYATLVRADTSFYDRLADFAADPTYGTAAAASDTTKYSDGKHPTTLTQNALEVISKAAIQTLL